MSERPENFEGFEDESEATLVTPRFDAAEASRAHPVVPLNEARTRAPYEEIHAPRARRAPRHSWKPALLAVAMLAVAALAGAVATKVLSRPDATHAAVQPATETTRTQTAEAPTQTQTVSTADAPRQNATATTAATAAPAAPAATVATDASVATAPRPARARRTRDAATLAPAAPAEATRADEDVYDEPDEDHRGRDRRRRHHGRDEDEGDREMRKAIRHAKEKMPRLVDVLVNP